MPLFVDASSRDLLLHCKEVGKTSPHASDCSCASSDCDLKGYIVTGGHDFRPAYRKLSRLRVQNKLKTPMMALTATAALKVKAM